MSNGIPIPDCTCEQCSAMGALARRKALVDFYTYTIVFAIGGALEKLGSFPRHGACARSYGLTGGRAFASALGAQLATARDQLGVEAAEAEAKELTRIMVDAYNQLVERGLVE